MSALGQPSWESSKILLSGVAGSAHYSRVTNDRRASCELCSRDGLRQAASCLCAALNESPAADGVAAMRPEEAAPFWRTTVKVFDACTSLGDLEKAPLAQAVTATGHDKQLAALRTEASQIRKELTDRAKASIHTTRCIAACATGVGWACSFRYSARCSACAIAQSPGPLLVPRCAS